MTTAIVGVGNIGSAVARHLTAGGEPVVLSSKDLSRAQALAEELGPLAQAASLEDAISGADAVLFAVWLDTMRELIPEHASLLTGKVVIDPSNPIGFDASGQMTRTLPEGESSGSVVAGLLPAGAHYVKAFGTLGADALAASANRDRGIRRVTGILIIAAYVVFTGSLLVRAHQPEWLQIVITAGTAVAIVFGVVLASGRRRGARKTSPPFPPPGRETAYPDPVRPADGTVNGHSSATDLEISDGSRWWKQSKSPVSGWPVRKLWLLGLAIPAAIAIVDAVLGHRVILIGLLIAGPCCALLTGRWIPTGLTGLWVIGLAVVLGLPDAIWGTSTHLAFLAAVAAVAMVGTLAAALIEIRTHPIRPR